MADIAFLLLIFFLVATQIVSDKGISIILPEYYDGPIGQAADRNVLAILINADNELLIESKLAAFKNIKSSVKDFVLNPTQSSDRPSSPSKAVISIQNDKTTTYEAYIDVYSQVQAAFQEMRDEAGNSKFGRPFAELTYSQKKSIAVILPIKISEADPF